VETSGGDRGSIRSRLTYANVIATIALFVALGGVSYAAVQLAKNSVKAKQIAPNAVGSSEIKDGAVGPSELDSEGLAGVTGDKGPQGDKGPTGDKGLQGDPGPIGGLTKIVARMDNDGPTSSPSTGGAATPVATTGGTWTQAADELDEIIGRVTVTRPGAPCNFLSGAEFGGFSVALKLGGVQIAQASGQPGSGAATFDLVTGANPILLRPVLFPPATPTARALTLEISDTCSNSNVATLTDLELAVVGYR